LDTTAFALDGTFVLSTLSIILIDIILSGDNSVVIAMAVQSLPDAQRRKGILIGAGAAAGMRVICTWFASQLMLTPFIKLVGGILIMWIAFKLLMENEEMRSHKKSDGSLWHAIKIIMIADATMSVDNMLAVAGASKGNPYLLWFGLGLSIPLVIFASTMLSKLMKKYPLIVLIGAAVLGKVGGEMVVTDPFVRNFLPESIWTVRVAEVIGVLLVLAIAWWVKRRVAREPAETGRATAAVPSDQAPGG
jgi:YjbE family integral membrane protein